MMITLKDYILEKKSDSLISEKEEDNEDKDKDKENGFRRADIKFTIWEEPNKKIRMITNNNKYQKIEYKHEDKEKDISIDFLMGFQDGVWKMWVGKIGSCSYDDDPYFSFDTSDFKQALLKCVDKVEEFIVKVQDDPHDYVQFYLHR